MDIKVLVGDILDQSADVLICPANPWLNLSGGVGGAVLARGGESIAAELRAHLTTIGKPAVSAGSVVKTSAGLLPFRHIIHAVAIDPFYDSSIELVERALLASFDLAGTLNSKTVSVPALATGYGHLPIEDFAHAVRSLMCAHPPSFEAMQYVFHHDDAAPIFREIALGT